MGVRKSQRLPAQQNFTDEMPFRREARTARKAMKWDVMFRVQTDETWTVQHRDSKLAAIAVLGRWRIAAPWRIVARRRVHLGARTTARGETCSHTAMADSMIPQEVMRGTTAMARTAGMKATAATKLHS
jgi:hypothetical protein